MATASPDDRCTRCASALVSISFSQGQSTVTMMSCAKCRRRTWRRGDEAVDLEGVLATLTESRLGPPRDRSRP